MTELRRVKYKLTSEGTPVIHLECRPIEDAIEARRISQASISTDESWQAKAIASLSKFDDKRLWSEVYIRCGRCKREWDAWLKENPVGDDLAGWIEKAAKVVTENRWI